MPRGKWIDRKTAQHFTLVHRPQNDPLIHDENAPAMVLNPTQRRNGASKVKRLDDLASEFGSEAAEIRANEGEAANYGVYFDDTEYDYMQHLRDLNAGTGEAVFIEAADKTKGKQKESLEDALKKMDLEQKSGDLFDDDILPSKNLTRVTYQAQQNVPDVIGGFQPDMDPRLREVLEALDDEAYIDDEDDDIFHSITKDGHEVDQYEFDRDDNFDDDDDGWESDGTAKPSKEYKDEAPQLVEVGIGPEAGPSQDWMENFKQFKKESKAAAAPSHSELQSAWTTTTNGGRRKKRKGALTDTSSFSMTSSSLVRTEQMTLLDARFGRLEQQYQEQDEDEDDDMASVSQASTVSTVDGPMRKDFDNILDDFLGGCTKPGKRTSKKAQGQTGLQQLEEIRRELGPARIRGRNLKT